jgi:4-amino-4-deoxy-L-arabinose transferase-like glycosyltransferase
MTIAPKRELGIVGAFAIAHLIAGLAVLPNAVFAKYPTAARQLVEGKLSKEAGSDYSPAYLLLDVLISPGALRVLQSFLGATAVFAVWWAARRMYGPVAGLLAAALTASLKPLLVYESVLEPDLLIAFFVALGISALVWADSTEKKVVWAGIGGALLGLSAATRPAGMLAIVATALWLMLRGFRLQAIKPLLAFSIAALVVTIAPAAILRRALDAPSGATMSPGQVIHHGNRPEGVGVGMQPPYLLMMLEAQSNRYAIHDLYRRFARASEGQESSVEETNRYWLSKTAAFIRMHPATFLALQVRKLSFFVFGPEAHDVFGAKRADFRLAQWPLPTLGVLGLPALAGAVTVVLRRRGVLPVVVVGAFAGVALVAYVISRYRLSAAPALCLLAAAWLSTLGEALRDRKLAVIAAVGLLFAATARWFSPWISDAQRLNERAAEASALLPSLQAELAAGKLQAARGIFVQMQAAQPFGILGWNLRGLPFESSGLADESAKLAAVEYGAHSRTDRFLLAVLAARAKRCDEALPVARELAASDFRATIFDRLLDPNLLGAECLLQAEDRAAAIDELNELLVRRPGTLEGLAGAIAGAPSVEQARTLREELFALHDPLTAGFELAHSFNQWGHYGEALNELQGVEPLIPESGLVKYERAVSLVGLGRDEEAASAYRDALRAFPAHSFPTAPFDALVGSLAPAAVAEDDQWLVIEHFIRAGRVEDARQFVQHLQTVPPLLAPQVEWLSKVRP